MLGLQIFTAVLFSASVLPSAHALPPCSFSTKAKEICDIQDLGLIHPTQLSVGYRAVKEKAQKLKDLSDDKYKEYLKDNPIPVVIGPDGYYPLDHHHLARSIFENGKSRAVLEIKTNWSKDPQLGTSIPVFINKMLSQGCQARVAGVSMDKSKPCFYLYGALGQSITVSDIPKSIWLMRDDPYRSLSGMVRDEGGFNKKATDFYVEFAWALFFRKYLPHADLQSHDGFKKAVKDALKIAHSPVAASMLGYIP